MLSGLIPSTFFQPSTIPTKVLVPFPHGPSSFWLWLWHWHWHGMAWHGKCPPHVYQPANTHPLSHSQTGSSLILFLSSPTSSDISPGAPPFHAQSHHRSECFVDLPHQCLVMPRAGTSLRHTQSINNARQPDRSPAPRPPRQPASCQLPTHRPSRPVPCPDRSTIAISASRFRYCRSWVICLMPSGPSWSGQEPVGHLA